MAGSESEAVSGYGAKNYVGLGDERVWEGFCG